RDLVRARSAPPRRRDPVDLRLNGNGRPHPRLLSFGASTATPSRHVAPDRTKQMPPRDLPTIDRSPCERAQQPASETDTRRLTARRVAPLLSLVIFLVALFVLSRQLAELDTGALMNRLGQTTLVEVAMALGLTAASFLVLSGYDLLALGQIGVRLPYRTVLSTSFQSYAFTNAIGFA